MRAGRIRLLTAVVLAVGLLAAAGCSSDDDPEVADTNGSDVGATDGTGSTPGSGDTTGEPGGGDADAAAGIEGVPWVLDASASSLPAGDLPTNTVQLGLEGGQVSGSDGCNRVIGGYELAGDRLSFEPLGGTMMACTPPEVMDQAARYVAALQEGGTVAVADGRLTIVTPGGATLVYAPEAPPEPLEPDDLVGSWTMTLEESSGEGVEASVSATPAGTITFGPDGSVSGQGPCNSFVGTYTADERSAFDVPPPTQTSMACGGDVDALETAVFGQLEGAANWGGLAGGTIELLGEDPAVRLLLTRAG